MKKTTNQSIDEMIAEALGGEERAGFEALAELGVFEQIAETFRGRSRWINLLVVLYSLGFTVLFGTGIYRFMNAEDTRGQIFWASVCVLSMVVIGMLKIWYWMEMNRVSVMREIKRLELQIARLPR